MKIEPVKKKNPEQTEPVKERRRRRRRRKKKKKNRTANPGEERKKKVKSGQKLWLGIVCGSPMCLITILSLNYELWKLKTAKMCFLFP